MSADDDRIGTVERSPGAVVISLEDVRARALLRARRRHPSASAVDPRPGGDAA